MGIGVTAGGEPKIATHYYNPDDERAIQGASEGQEENKNIYE
jgi:hypothetical protein